MSITFRIRELKREAIRLETAHQWQALEVLQGQIAALEARASSEELPVLRAA